MRNTGTISQLSVSMTRSSSLKYDADTAVEFAFKVIKMNKAIDTLADNMKD